MPHHDDQREQGFESSAAAFFEHFDIEYDDFMIAMTRLSDSEQSQYGKTYEANKEAAVLWAIKVCKEKGILQEE